MHEKLPYVDIDFFLSCVGSDANGGESDLQNLNHLKKKKTNKKSTDKVIINGHSYHKSPNKEGSQIQIRKQGN